jgi:mono/diheme cytochrome c family protein
MEKQMLRSLILTFIAMALTVGAAYADPSKTKVTIPVNKTSPVSGKQMYVNYCAPCHGVDGKGHGPVVASLKTPPPDLTLLSKNNGGKFPEVHVETVLQNGVKIPAHGSAEMPIWGPILGKMNPANHQDSLLRISNLIRYLETLQVK